MSTEAHGALRLLQRHLDGLYRVEMPSGVERFVISEDSRCALEEAGAITPRPGAREEIYVVQQHGDMLLAVYIDATALAAVQQIAAGGSLQLEGDLFQDFCIALEGVSHFLLLTHRAARELPVTQLELELQAEVDKYLAARLLTWATGIGPVAAEIRHVLFHDFQLSPGLDDEASERYRTANRLALHYCDYLERAFLRERRMLSLLRELRRFYRASQGERLVHIAR